MALAGRRKAAATFTHPEYRKRLKLGWTAGGVPQHLHLWREEDGALVVPRRLLAMVPSTDVAVEDRRLALPRVEFGWRGNLRPE